MKLSLKLILLISLASILAAGCAAPVPAAAPAGTGRSIRVGMDPSLPPFEYLDANNAPVGLDIDLIQAVMAKSDLQVELIDAGINIPTLLEQCRIEAAISAIPINPALNPKMAFSAPYYKTGNSLVVKKGNLTITGIDQLAGMTVGVEVGASLAPEIGGVKDVIIKPYSTFYLAVMDLTNGYIDAVVADTAHARASVAIRRNNLKIVGPEFGAIEYGIAVCKGREELLRQVNAGLAAIKADGTLDKLIKKWLPSS